MIQFGEATVERDGTIVAPVVRVSQGERTVVGEVARNRSGVYALFVGQRNVAQGTREEVTAAAKSL